MFVCSCKCGVTEDHECDKKRRINTEVKKAASEEKYDVSCWTSDLTNTQCTCDFDVVDTTCNVEVSRPKASDAGGNVPAADKAREFACKGKELDSRGLAAGQLTRFSDNVPLCSSCQAVEQQHRSRTARPRSLEVASDFKVNAQGYHYENLQHVFRNPARAVSGSCLSVNDGRNNEDAKDIESQSSCSSSVSATITTQASQIMSSASVDTAIDRTKSTVCKCNDADKISYRFAYNAVELDSVMKNFAGVAGVSSEQCFCESKTGKMIPNQTAHCSRPSGEVSLLNKDLLKYCSDRNPRFVSMPIDIVSAQRLPSEQRAGNLLSTLTSHDTAAAGQTRDCKPACSRCSVLLGDDAQTVRKRAYRVGLNFFNR